MQFFLISYGISHSVFFLTHRIGVSILFFFFCCLACQFSNRNTCGLAMPLDFHSVSITPTDDEIEREVSFYIRATMICLCYDILTTGNDPYFFISLSAGIRSLVNLPDTNE